MQVSLGMQPLSLKCTAKGDFFSVEDLSIVSTNFSSLPLPLLASLFKNIFILKEYIWLKKKSCVGMFLNAAS